MVSDGRKRADYQVLKQHKKVQKKHEISGDLQRPRLIGKGNGEQLQATGLPLPPDRESSRSRGMGRRGKGARIGVSVAWRPGGGRAAGLWVEDMAVGGPGEAREW